MQITYPLSVSWLYMVAWPIPLPCSSSRAYLVLGTKLGCTIIDSDGSFVFLWGQIAKLLSIEPVLLGWNWTPLCRTLLLLQKPYRLILVQSLSLFPVWNEVFCLCSKTKNRGQTPHCKTSDIHPELTSTSFIPRIWKFIIWKVKYMKAYNLYKHMQ